MNNLIDVLLAEDEEHIAKLIAYKLGKEGYCVTIAKNGQEAIDLLKVKPWAMAILDVLMPVRDGWEVLRAIRAMPEFTSLPVLILTAKKYENTERVGEEQSGAQQYLRKPFDPNDLAQLVKRMIPVGAHP